MLEQYIEVDPQWAGMRLDVFLARQVPKIPSRSFAQKLIRDGSVTINGASARVSDLLSAKDQITVKWIFKPLSESILPEDIPLNIFYEDPWILIVNKPPGMLVHPVHGVYQGTLVNALMFHCKQLSQVNLPDEDDDALDPGLIRPGVVHRLDRETSGLLVVAKDNRAHIDLARQFEKHQVEKKYLALVQGHVRDNEGMIDAPLGRHPRFRDKKSVVFDKKARSAFTFYKVIRRDPGSRTLVALYPKSGRTHQLRVHMAYIKHPILGDDKYGDAKSFSRMALHAQCLGFMHPHWQKFVEFSTVMPKEFR